MSAFLNNLETYRDVHRAIATQGASIIEQDLLRKYHRALSKAIPYIFRFNLKPDSALKEAGASEGIEHGGEMLQFVNWSKAELEERGIWL